MKLISIITPAFNAERYIEKTISSVLNQTYSNWEMIIVDDCSTDATASIAKEYSYKDKRIKVITHEKNQGVAAARNPTVIILRKNGRRFACSGSPAFLLSSSGHSSVMVSE